ncbi:sister chromatid cohesion protein PDS5 homolog B isoform X1 [Coffea arabica]|uniref:Sister chromatid cohesion protein PDS5 homolog B isoform X1 n=2 Tax=Coffea arabica TaxID=13443 RepID=A0A6P6UL69_COFAR|nr:sister chromatid cohesion protein PDS5 homolog A-like isoform X1 [Coffea arabica]
MAAAESEAEAQQLISRLGKQLKASKTCPNKDSLVKWLKEAVIALGKFKQLKSLNSVIQPLSDSLIKHGLLQHKDKDIRILVATCFCEIIRVLAPDPGFSDDVFTDIFKLLQSIFAETGDYKSPYFSRRVKLLETVAKLNVCVLMLDVGCEDLILKMFKIFFSAAREQHPQSVINAMSSIMARILEDKLEEKDLESLIFQEKFSEPLLDVIIQNLLKESKGGSGGFARLAVSVIQNCNEKLERCICTFLRSCILNRESIGSELKEWYHDILYEIFRSAPQMLVSVIPSLSHELLTDQVDVRIKALNLLRKCFSLPGHNIAEEYHNLFMDFLNRFTDKSAEVRLCALSCGKALYTNNPSGTGSSQILTELESRLLDFDDRVRMQAVSIVCDVARLQIGSVTNELISQVADRLRDKKVSVRKKALQKLLELYQDYCTKCVGDIKMHFEQIPCKILMLCYDKDCKEFRPQSLEYVLAEDLFPVSLSVEGRTNHWIFLSSLFTPLHVNALNAILSQKRRLRNALQAYLHLRVHKEEIGSDEMERNTKALFKKMSALFPDPAEAEECFYKLNQVNDNDIFKMLADMINVGDALSTRDNLLRKIGDQSPLFDFLRLLSSKCSLNIFSSRHVSCILDHLTFDKSIRNTKLDYSPLLLLSAIISAFPSLLRSSEEKFRQLLADEDIPFNEQLIQFLAKEGSNISIKLSDCYNFLERVRLEGTQAEAKLAVSAIAALSDSSEEVIVPNLCKTSCTIKKHSEQCLKSSLTSDANKSANSNLTLSKSADASRIWIEGLQKTSHQEVHSGGTVEVHNESSVDNQHEIHASVISESIMSKERVGSSCDSVATKPTLGLKEDFPSCLQERDMNMTYNSNTDKVAKLSTANHKKVNLAKENKDKGEASDVEHRQMRASTHYRWNDGENSSVHSKRETSGACDSDCEGNSLKKTKFFAEEIPLPAAENTKKIRRSKVAASKAINVNKDMIARRTRRQKV